MENWHAAQRRAWGQKIRDARKALHLSQRGLADVMAERGVPITYTAVGLWEQGRTAPSDYMRIQVARALGRHEAELFSYTVPVPEKAA